MEDVEERRLHLIRVTLETLNDLVQPLLPHHPTLERRLKRLKHEIRSIEKNKAEPEHKQHKENAVAADDRPTALYAWTHDKMKSETISQSTAMPTSMVMYPRDSHALCVIYVFLSATDIFHTSFLTNGNNVAQRLTQVLRTAHVPEGWQTVLQQQVAQHHHQPPLSWSQSWRQKKTALPMRATMEPSHVWNAWVLSCPDGKTWTAFSHVTGYDHASITPHFLSHQSMAQVDLATLTLAWTLRHVGQAYRTTYMTLRVSSSGSGMDCEHVLAAAQVNDLSVFVNHEVRHQPHDTDANKKVRVVDLSRPTQHIWSLLDVARDCETVLHGSTGQVRIGNVRDRGVAASIVHD